MTIDIEKHNIIIFYADKNNQIYILSEYYSQDKRRL